MWCLPVSLILLSIAWSPQLQKRQMYPSKDVLDQLNADLRESQQHSTQLDIEYLIFTQPELSCRWKMSLISAVIKIFVIILTCVFYLLAKNQHHPVAYSFLDLNVFNKAFPAFIVHFLSSLIGDSIAFLSCTMTFQIIGFAIPLCLATPLSFVILILLDKYGMDIRYLDISFRCGSEKV